VDCTREEEEEEEEEESSFVTHLGSAVALGVLFVNGVSP